ncbi:NAD(+) synthase [Halobaculum marinum]|uniref:NH(3)-dependent NAD(+) synthetase n=1 Tax=Halobaculum marinum TaxID=3031996 RepID=A0ABD5X627_9EURY|nr:NAD(+) synthase [Halobaculum sp. DT55]
MSIGSHGIRDTTANTSESRPPELLCDRAVRLVRETVDDADADGAVVALSGGVDSATTAAVAVEALGADNVYTLALPTAETRDEDTDDAREWATTLGVDHATAPLAPAVDVFRRHLAPRIAPAGDEYAAGNLAARLRMAAAYFVANATNRLVVGTANRTERLLGYYTKYGDGGVDLLPLGEYDKGEVRTLAAHLGVPEQIREKAPTAGFWDGQTDEADLGATYATLDRVVDALDAGERGVRPPAAVVDRLDADPATVAEQAARMHRTAHKRTRPSAPPRPLRVLDGGDGLVTGGERVGHVADDLTSFVRERVETAGARRVVVRLSGDVGSSVVAALAADALGPERVYGLHLPCHKTSRLDRPDPAVIADDLGIEFDRVNVRPLVVEMESALPHEVTERAGVRELANLVSRVRMACAYYVANTETDLVLGTTDRTDLQLGRVTKFGDEAVDLRPLGGLYRTEVAALGRHLDLPDSVVEQSADVGATVGAEPDAEMDIERSAATVDGVLEGLVDRDIGITRTAAAQGVDPVVVRRCAQAHVRSQHKRSTPPTTADRPDPGPFHELELKFETGE